MDLSAQYLDENPHGVLIVCRESEGFALREQCESEFGLRPGKLIDRARTLDAIHSFIPDSMKNIGKRLDDGPQVVEVWI
jgi:hypothetical protein